MRDCVERLRGQNLPAIANYRQICIFLSTSCSSHVTALYVKFYCEIAFHFGFKHCVKGFYEEKSPWVTVKKKPSPKKVEKSFGEAKKRQLAESDKGSWYNQSNFL